MNGPRVRQRRLIDETTLIEDNEIKSLLIWYRLVGLMIDFVINL